MAAATFVTGTSALNRLLPCQTGYALGRIVLSREIELPYLIQEMENLALKINKITESKRLLKLSAGTQLQGDASDSSFADTKAQLQDQLSALDYDLGLKTRHCRAIQEKIFKFEKEQGEDYATEGSTLTQMLPIDYEKSKFITRDLGNESETLDYILVEHRDSAKREVQRFARRLMTTYDSPGALRLITQVAEDIFDMLTGDQKVCVLGSFVTLRGVRTFDPLIIRDTSTLSSKILDNASKYSVITQSILGGLFVGYAYYGGSVSERKLSGSQMASKISAFHYISQGALHTTKLDSLWDTYEGWKTQLKEEGGGFPIAFSVRNLAEILTENGKTT